MWQTRVGTQFQVGTENGNLFDATFGIGLGFGYTFLFCKCELAFYVWMDL